jgi:hypothetical protein
MAVSEDWTLQVTDGETEAGSLPVAELGSHFKGTRELQKGLE